MTEETTGVELHPVGFHYGNVIKYLAETHGTGFEVIREAVQNALDKGAKNIFVLIDCVKCLIEVFDDGNGASKAELAQKFDKIGLSLKLGQPGMMGQKGIGNLAPFAIGREWQLFTRDILKGEPLRAYSLASSELSKVSGINVQSEEVPFKSVKGAPFAATTMLRIVDVASGVLRQLGDKGQIERTLRETFNAKLQGDKISLRVAYRPLKGQPVEFTVKATKFRGSPLQPVEYETEHGPVTFEFYHSPEPVKDPSILVLHQGVYSLPLSNFFMLKILPPELEPLFTKGYFEGEVRLAFCTINSSRSAFEHNVEQKSFVGAVEQFSAEILKPLIEQFEQTGRQERLKKIAESVLKKMRQFLNKNPSLLPPHLKSRLIKSGAEGQSPEERDSETIVSPDPDRKKALPPDAFKQQRKKTLENKPKTKRPILDVRDGLAIQVVNPEADEGFAWHSRLTEKGIIQLNAMNNEFTEAERRGQTVLHRYMFLLVQKELTCASMTPHEAHIFNSGFEKTFLSFWKASLFE